MIPDPSKHFDSRDIIRALREQGLLQPQFHVRDQEEVFTALLNAVLNDSTYTGKVQHLIELYGSAYPRLSQNTKEEVDEALKGVGAETPTPRTSVEEHGTQGSMLIVEQSRSEGNSSALPLDHPDFYRIFMQSEMENAHIRMYLKLSPVLGLVIEDLVDAELLPKRFASETRSVDLSDLRAVVDAKPQ